MGCAICGGASYQYCLAPDCRSHVRNPETLKELGIFQDISNSAGSWKKIIRHPIRCDLCNKEATYAHPMGGLRCDSCPKPTK